MAMIRSSLAFPAFARSASFASSRSKPDFGLVFDIDGVIVRGKRVLPFAPDAFRMLLDPKTGAFRVPTVFLTNAGNSLRKTKADQLSEWLRVEVSDPWQVISSPFHSPFDYR